MRCNLGVSLQGVRPEITRTFSVIDEVYGIYHHLPVLVATLSPKGRLTELHEAGLAIDITCSLYHRVNIIRALECRLGDQYVIKPIGDYLHIAFIGTVNERETL